MEDPNQKDGREGPIGEGQAPDIGPNQPGTGAFPTESGPQHFKSRAVDVDPDALPAPT
jgi:hypothetical protein